MTTRNPFLVGRIVFFVILIYINLITLISAAIHIAVVVNHGFQVSGAPLFVIFNNCALFFSCFVAFAELLIPKVRTTQVKFECAWTFLLSIMQIAASIDITVNGPPAFCHGLTVNGAACTSSSILIPTTWLQSTALLFYCILLISITISHSDERPAIWSASVYNVPWFTVKNKKTAMHILPLAYKDLPPLPRPGSRTSSISTSELPIASAFMHPDKEAQAPDPSLFYNLGINETFDRPAWAKRNETRRGLDAPFTISGKKRQEGERSARAVSPASSSGSRFVEGLQEPKLTAWMDRKTGALKPTFPQAVYDPDAPIPLPHRSQWLRADHDHSGARTNSTKEELTEEPFQWFHAKYAK